MIIILFVFNRLGPKLKKVNQRLIEISRYCFATLTLDDHSFRIYLSSRLIFSLTLLEKCSVE